MGKEPNVAALNQPAKLNDVLAEQREYTDCLSCRVMGSVAFTGLGLYTLASGTSQLRQREREIMRSGSRFGLGARKMGIYGMSAGLVGMGVYRLIN